MLLNLGLPADAAASHRHEFSSQHDPKMNPAEPQGSQYSYLQPLHYLHEKLLAFTGAGPSTEQEDEETQTRPSTPLSSTAEASTNDGRSVVSTEARRPSIAKKKTVYQLSHPISRPSRKHLRRPPMILQLRRLEENRRAATPVLEVFRKRSLSRPATRSLSKRSSTLSSTSKGDGHRERLVFLNCDSYDAGDGTEDTSEDEKVERQDIVASVSYSTYAGASTQATIHIEREQWTVSAMPKGGYEFSHVDDDGNFIRARWASKPVSERRPIAEVPSPLQRPTSDKQYRFVLLNCAGRKHPIIGSMDCNAIEVRDQYVIPDTPAVTPDLSSLSDLGSVRKPFQSSYFHDPQTPVTGAVTTSDHTRLLMLVTGAWVAITEGWTQYGGLVSDSAECLPIQPSSSPHKDLAVSPHPELRQDNRSTTPRSFTSSMSHVFGGRRHRHTITEGSASVADNSFNDHTLILCEQSIRSSPTPSLEDMAGLGIDVSAGNSIFEPPIMEEPALPAKSKKSKRLRRLLGFRRNQSTPKVSS